MHLLQNNNTINHHKARQQSIRYGSDTLQEWTICKTCKCAIPHTFFDTTKMADLGLES